MDIQRAVHGDAAICGHKFPQEIRKHVKAEFERRVGEPSHVWECRRYLISKDVAAEEAKTPDHEREFRDMNPEEFWEMAFTVKGIIYHPHFKVLLAGIRRGDFKVVKVVSQGLIASDPAYLGKIIYSIRHPRAVAKSQERLIRGFNFTGEDGKEHNAFEDMVIHTPEMFVNVTVQASQFLLFNPGTPIHFLHFEELIREPKRVIDDMSEFVGRGDYSKAYEIVQPKLNRSKHEDIESPLWDDADFVYEHFCAAAEIINTYKGDNRRSVESVRRKAEKPLTEIIRYMSDPKRNTNREKRHWACYRARSQVNEALCRECIKGGIVAFNFKSHSESTPSSHGVTKHWSEEPCLFECGMDLDRGSYLSIEESIENNFWLNLPDTKEGFEDGK